MKAILAVILGLAIMPSVRANGLGGQRLEKVVGDWIVDVGTDQTSTPVAGQPIEFDFDLLQSNTREPVGLATSVGIDIQHNGKSVVNCDLITELPMAFLIYSFPEGGGYTLTVSFFDSKREKKELASAKFPLTISGSSGNLRSRYIPTLLASLAVGLLGFYWGTRRRGTR
jgi:hypothetical protein